MLLLPSYFKSIGEFVFLMNGIDDLIVCTHRLRLLFIIFATAESVLKDLP